MASLHIFNQPEQLHAAVALLSTKDVVLLCGDALYALDCLANSGLQQFALLEDVKARGLQLPEFITGLDYADWVQLCVDSSQVVAW